MAQPWKLTVGPGVVQWAHGYCLFRPMGASDLTLPKGHSKQGDPYDSLQKARGQAEEGRLSQALLPGVTGLASYSCSGDRAWSQEDYTREPSRPFWELRTTGHDRYALAQCQGEEVLSTDHEGTYPSLRDYYKLMISKQVTSW